VVPVSPKVEGRSPRRPPLPLSQRQQESLFVVLSPPCSWKDDHRGWKRRRSRGRCGCWCGRCRGSGGRCGRGSRRSGGHHDRSGLAPRLKQAASLLRRLHNHAPELTIPERGAFAEFSFEQPIALIEGKRHAAVGDDFVVQAQRRADGIDRTPEIASGNVKVRFSS
jgi:hypothetical protein